MVSKINLKEKVICIVGLGYVGLPLAEEFSKHFKVIGFDIDNKKIEKLNSEHNNLELTSDPSKIKIADFVIITVPTPVTKSKEPDLSFVKSASRIVGQNLKRDAIVVLESTVYPGVTEEVVGPILEKESRLMIGRDFKIGYSPERINPGDENHTIDKITKIVSGMDEESTSELIELYGNVTNVYKVRDIKIAEAAKIIENIQRDLNIALINEFSIIFNKMNLDTKEILDAASTKWNFVRFSPGLVGGHCIPIDPYYLVYKAEKLGYHPQVILAGRSINDYMPEYVVKLTIEALNEAGKIIEDSKVLIIGLTFKENVKDIRETPVMKIIRELKEFKCVIYGYDPLLSGKEIDDFDIKILEDLNDVKVDCVIITVMHNIFKKIGLNKIKEIMRDKPVLIDVRGAFRREAKESGFIYRNL